MVPNVCLSILPCVLEIISWHVMVMLLTVSGFKPKQLQMFAVPAWASVQHHRRGTLF